MECIIQKIAVTQEVYLLMFQLNQQIVGRLQGNQSDYGKELLNQSGLNVIGEDSLQLAAQKIVELVR